MTYYLSDARARYGRSRAPERGCRHFCRGPDLVRSGGDLIHLGQSKKSGGAFCDRVTGNAYKLIPRFQEKRDEYV